MMSNKRKALLKLGSDLAPADTRDKGDSSLKAEVEPLVETLPLSFDVTETKENRNLWLNRRLILAMMFMVITGGVALSVLTYANSQVKQIVDATGQLKNQKIPIELQAPLNRVINEVYVKKGEKVGKGQPLVMFVAEEFYERLKFLEDSRYALLQQNQFYRLLIKQSIGLSQVEGEILRLQLPREAAFLVRSRASLAESIAQLKKQALDKQLEVEGVTEKLTASTDEGLESNLPIASVKLELQQIKDQLERNQMQRDDARSRLEMAHKKLAKLKNLLKEGAIAQIEYLEVQQSVKSQKAELEKLLTEEQRLKTTLTRGEQQLNNTIALSEQTLLKKIADRQQQIDNYQKQFASSQKQIGEIDSQLNKIGAENEKSIAELDSQIRSLKATSNPLIVRSPIEGTVIKLQASPGLATPSTQAKSLLKIVPDASSAIAEVLVSQKDIPLIQEGMKAEIEIDIPPFQQLGKIEGKITTIGSDLLPPNPNHALAALPVKISLAPSKLAITDKPMPIPFGTTAKVTIPVTQKQAGLKTTLLSFWQNQ